MNAALGTEDVVGLSLEEAEKQLKSAGFQVEIQKTYPTKRFSGNGRWRVLRQLRSDAGFLLTAAEESVGVSSR